jgi:Rrf2 family cysteine metabolism transcriptional repressor
VYGVIAMVELGMSHNSGPIQIKDIALPHGIPQHYLEQLLVILKKAGLVQSFRGALGGYTLAKNPNQIKILDILTYLDGKVEIVPENRKNNILSFFWDKIELNTQEILDISLEELIMEKQTIEQRYIYNI